MTAVAHFGDLLRIVQEKTLWNENLRWCRLRAGRPDQLGISRYINGAIRERLDIRKDPILANGLRAIDHDARFWAIRLEDRKAILYFSRGTSTQSLDRSTMLFDVVSAFRSAKIGSGNLRPEILLRASTEPFLQASHIISLIGVHASVEGVYENRVPIYFRTEASMVEREPNEGHTDFVAVKRSLWQAKLVRTLVFMVGAFEYCGCRFGLVRIHDQWGRLFTLSDKTIALECNDEFLSARVAERRASAAATAEFLADEHNSSHLPHTWDQQSSSPERMFAFVRQAAEVLLHVPVTDPLPPVDTSPIHGTSSSLDLAPSLAFLEPWKEPSVRHGELPQWPPERSDGDSDMMDVSSEEGMEVEGDPAADVGGPDEPPRAYEVEEDCAMGDIPGISKADFLALPGMVERTEVFLESMQIDDGPTESSMTERSTTVSSYDPRNYYSSHGDASVTSERLDQQTEILLSVLDRYGVRVVLVSTSEMDVLAGIDPGEAQP